MYDLSQWPYADEAVECLRDAHRFLMYREQSRSIMDSTHEVYRSGGQIDWKSVLDDLGIASGKLGISPYTAHLVLLVHLLDEAERRYRSHGLSDDIFHDSFDDLRVKCEECFRVYGTYGTFVALWITRFHEMRCFAFGRLEAEVVPFRVDGSPVINIHIPSKGRLVESECRASYQKAADFYHLERFVTDSWLLNPVNRQLGKESGIVRFAKDYRLLSMSDTMDISDISALPARTRLQRIWRSHLASGGFIERGYGTFTLLELEGSGV